MSGSDDDEDDDEDDDDVEHSAPATAAATVHQQHQRVQRADPHSGTRADASRILTAEDFALIGRLRAAQAERQMDPKSRSKKRSRGDALDAGGGSGGGGAFHHPLKINTRFLNNTLRDVVSHNVRNINEQNETKLKLQRNFI